MGWLEGFLTAAVVAIVVGEAQAWLPWAANFLLNLAVEQLPQPLRERYREEWLADLAETPGHIGKLVNAFGLLYAGFKIRKSNSSNFSENNTREWLVKICACLLLMPARIYPLKSFVKIKIDLVWKGPVSLIYIIKLGKREFTVGPRFYNVAFTSTIWHFIALGGIPEAEFKVKLIQPPLTD